MMALIRSLALLLILATLGACGSSPSVPAYDYGAYVASNPRSVIVAPMTAQGDSSRHYLSIVAQPLAERGYYVMPVRLTQQLFADTGYQERAQDIRRAWSGEVAQNIWKLVDEDNHPGVREMAIELTEMSGADSVLFVYVLQSSHKVDVSEGFLKNLVDERMNHTINLDYLLASDSGETLWRTRKKVIYTRGGGSFLQEIWNASYKASDTEIDTAIARDVNRLMIEGLRTKNEMSGSWYPGYPMLVGPYRSGYEADRIRRQPVEQ